MQKKARHQSPSLKLALGFLVFILIGTFLLFLPISHQEGKSLSFIDSLVLATSAVCVTGLTPVDLSQTLSYFGSTVMMVLFQIGGLGYSVIAVTLIALSSRKVDLLNRGILRDSLISDNSMDIMFLLKFTLATTFFIEAIGALLLFMGFYGGMSTPRAIYVAIFTSLAAFNNAGFDLFSTSLVSYYDSPLVILTVAGLIICGGLGFVIYLEAMNHRKGKKFSLHFKVVLMMTAILLLVGTVLFRLTMPVNMLNAFFQSVTTRTAGFFSYDQSMLSNAAIVLTIILMYIGASPGSTGGGIKTTTFFVSFKAGFSIITGRNPSSFKRSLGYDVILKALILIVLSIMLCTLGFLIMTITDPDIAPIKLLYETVSAFGTVGLSMAVTPELSIGGKLVIIILMYAGRVGILTLISVFSRKARQAKYVEEKVAIG